ncbi:MAG: hypothetical protein Q8942_11155 [Bacillota bacterium]|nr:hypothetical protein [Bacillota bacterium]
MKKKFLLLAVVSILMVFSNVISAFALNPQPEPPGDRLKFINPGVLVGFVPQPEPPGDLILFQKSVVAVISR